MRRPERHAQRLRSAIDGMPLGTRNAMLDAIGTGPLIVGAYTDREGGVCPMLAAHRNGGRTSFAAFAHAWDGYARAGRRSRPATQREIRTLRSMLEASVAAEDGGDLADAIVSHRRARWARQSHTGRPAAHRGTPPPEPAGSRPGERDRTGKPRRRDGWAWLRPVRGLDEYERALEALGMSESPIALEARKAGGRPSTTGERMPV